MKRITLLFLILAFTLTSYGRVQNTSDSIVEDGFRFAAKQLRVAMSEIENGGNLRFPRTINESGKFVSTSTRDWTSGFFPGELWYMYEYTKNSSWEQAARRYTAPIEDQKTNGTTHDMGFKMYCSFGNGYRLSKDENYKKILIESAYTLISRYIPNVGVIRSWDFSRDKWQCPVIIDNMMNLELLFWAFKETNDSTFYQVATSHADMTSKNHFRPNYSSYHVIDYDTISGEVRKRNTHQGYADESSWARGQAWGLYGFTMCYRETGKVAYLEQAKHIASFIFSNPNLPEDLIPYWDYNAPGIPNEPRDASAASCTASALYELSMYDKENATQYKAWADTIIKNLSNHYRAKEGGDSGFLLLHSTGSKPGNSEVDKPLVYADYYYLEALLRKHKLETTGTIF